MSTNDGVTSPERMLTRAYQSDLGAVRGFLRRLAVPAHHLDDLCHDVFCIAWKRLGEYDPARPLRPWLLGIAAHAASAFRRSAKHRPEAFDDAPEVVDPGRSADEHVERTHARAIVRRAVAALPAQRRAVFEMHELEGKSVRAIAERFGTSMHQAYSQLGVARGEFSSAVTSFTRLRVARAPV